MASTTKAPRKRARSATRDATQDAVRVVREGTREPRLPHEGDESADSQVKATPDTQAIGRKAYDDVRAGRVDTDRGLVLEQLGGRLPSHNTPAPQKRRPSR